MLRWRSLGELSPVYITWNWKDSEGLWQSSVLDAALPTWRLRPNTRLEHHDPANCMAWNKMKKKKMNRQNPKTNGKSKTK